MVNYIFFFGWRVPSLSKNNVFFLNQNEHSIDLLSEFASEKPLNICYRFPIGAIKFVPSIFAIFRRPQKDYHKVRLYDYQPWIIHKQISPFAPAKQTRHIKPCNFLHSLPQKTSMEPKPTILSKGKIMYQSYNLFGVPLYFSEVESTFFPNSGTKNSWSFRKIHGNLNCSIFFLRSFSEFYRFVCVFLFHL